MDFETIAPIIIPTLNRYDHFKKCVESLAKCSLSDKTELVIGLDYPPSPRYEEGWKQIKEYIPTISGFKKVTVLEETKNLGPAKNAEKLRRYVKEQGYYAFICSEDDNVFSPSFLEYMNWGLKTFKDDQRLLAICGFKRVDTSFLTNNVYIYPQFVAWGYGMWFDRRDKLDKWTDMKVLENYVRNCSLTTMFTPEIYKIWNVLRMIKHRYILGDSLPYFLPEEERYCLYPSISKVRNEGFDGSGLHCGDDKARAIVYHNLKIDDALTFVPHITEPLYCERLKNVYNAAYKRPISIKRKIVASTSFIIYKFTGKFWSIP